MVKKPRNYESVLSGVLKSGTTPREILWSVLKERTITFGILRIVDADRNIEGELGVFQSTFVVGASIRGGNYTAYEALKVLLTVKNGSFKYLSSADPLPSDLDNLERIRLTSLISIWPNFPHSPQALSYKNSINRMRGIKAEKDREEPNGADTKDSKESEVLAIDHNVLKQLQAWDERHMHIRAAAFWSTFVAVSFIAALLGMGG
ncbi:MAG: hypothetical protein U0103_28380 [Candidatus Obscuribacterales bacterium]